MERFFNWLNKDPETPLEGLLIAMTGLGMFITFFAVIGLTTTFVEG